MMQSNSFKIILAAPWAAALLTACGGGGSDNNPPVLENSAPVIQAGDPQTVKERNLVQLQANLVDYDGDAAVSWAQISGPIVDLTNINGIRPSFRAPNVARTQEIVLEASADDGVNPPSTSQVTITVEDTSRDGSSPQGIPDDDNTRKNRARNRPRNRRMEGGLEVRNYDGSVNNIDNPDWGATFEYLQRLGPVGYADGFDSMGGEARESARFISNMIHNQDPGEYLPNEFGTSDFIWQWGQFIDHDMDLTDGVDESADILIPLGDSYFDPDGTGAAVMPFNRARYDAEAVIDSDNPRQQENEISSWIDGSMIYGSDDVRIVALRNPDAPHLLLTSAGNLLPFNTTGELNANTGGGVLFLAGDVRANEQVGLTVIHTLFMREHNRLAELFMAANPDADPDDIFERARRVVIGKIQRITYEEWLPALIGPDAIPNYRGYRDNVNPTIYNEFSVAAFRVGHTMVNAELKRLNADGTEYVEGHLPLAEAFFRSPDLLTDESDLDPFLRGLAFERHQTIDVKLVHDLRNLLFGAPGSGGLDLAALNIQRGRDHGIPSYNDLRAALGLTRQPNFTALSSDPAVTAALEAAYSSVDYMDAWTGGLSEDPVTGSQLGELFHTIIAKQFRDLRDADRFWYEIYLPSEDLDLVNDSSLADIVRDNTGIGHELQDNVFYVP